MEKIAYFAGGCFWCVTPTFYELGANKVVCGYSGGKEVDPTYEDVKHQNTGHRETIAIYYDEDKLSYERLLEVFIDSVDPFDGGGQYIDRGHSYTLAIYYNDDVEKKIATKLIDDLRNSSGKEVYIALEKFDKFYTAEEYHQNYYLKNPVEFEKELIESGRKK